MSKVKEMLNEEMVQSTEELVSELKEQEAIVDAMEAELSKVGKTSLVDKTKKGINTLGRFVKRNTLPIVGITAFGGGVATGVKLANRKSKEEDVIDADFTEVVTEEHTVEEPIEIVEE